MYMLYLLALAHSSPPSSPNSFSPFLFASREQTCRLKENTRRELQQGKIKVLLTLLCILKINMLRKRKRRKINMHACITRGLAPPSLGSWPTLLSTSSSSLPPWPKCGHWKDVPLEDGPPALGCAYQKEKRECMFPLSR